MFPTVSQIIHITIEPEKYLAVCDLSQCYELDILLQKRIKKLEKEYYQDSEKDNNLDIANIKHQILLKQSNLSA